VNIVDEVAVVVVATTTITTHPAGRAAGIVNE
jgi:hypothetical protein